MSNFHISIQFFLQLAFILTVIRIVGYLGRRFLGQPQVVCEMITGVLLGPSFFGLYFPETFKILFPKETIPVIYSVSQVGLVLYMFLIGAEFRTDIVAKRLKTALTVSISGIAFPFILAGFLATYLVTGAPYFTEGVDLLHRWMFLGAAISITAFPMLARIIHETKIGGTSTGTIALAAGSLDDAAAWCILALVLAGFSGDSKIAWMAIGGGTVYAITTLTVVKKAFAYFYEKIESRRPKTERFDLPNSVFGVVMVLLMLAAYVTDAVGIYAVFGAFILGIAMPKGKFTNELEKKIEPITVNLLLPLFFIYSGLNTKLSLLFEGSALMVSVLILIASIAGKFLACSGAAYLGGESPRGSVCIGILMNARGLMELILLNIGLDRGIITPSLFTALVFMAVVTTLMATPFFNLFYKKLRIVEDTPVDTDTNHRANAA